MTPNFELEKCREKLENIKKVQFLITAVEHIFGKLWHTYDIHMRKNVDQCSWSVLSVKEVQALNIEKRSKFREE